MDYFKYQTISPDEASSILESNRNQAEAGTQDRLKYEKKAMRRNAKKSNKLKPIIT